MRFSIITPTLLRLSLVKCCESLDAQTHTDWEHIVWVDGPFYWNKAMVTLDKRTFIQSNQSYKNYGNTPRHHAWDFAKGDYVVYLDDDNYFARPDALADIAFALTVHPVDWAVFPILRFGQRFFTDNPRSCHVDTANMVIRREIAQWPDGPEYTMDGIFCDQLRAKPNLTLRTFSDVPPIIAVPVQGKGE